MSSTDFRAISDVQTPSSNSPMEQPADLALEEPVVTPVEEIEIQQMAYAGDDEEDALEAARALDAVDEARRSADAQDYGDEEEYDEYEARGCKCLECLNYDSQEDDRYNDDGYYGNTGLDWNESGYFD